MAENQRRLYQASYRTDQEEDNTSETSPTNDGATEDQNLSPVDLTWKQRYSDLRRFNTNLTDRVKELETQLRATQNKEIKLPSTKEELEAFGQKYPDVFRNIRSIVLTELMQEREHIANETQLVKDDLEKVKRERGVQKILMAHPDFEDINMSEEFHDWAKMQKQEIQNWLFEENDPDLCIRGLDLYKADMATRKRTAPREARADRQVAPRSTVNPSDMQDNKRIWKASEIQSMHPKMFEKFENDIERARLEGRIDLTA